MPRRSTAKTVLSLSVSLLALASAHAARADASYQPYYYQQSRDTMQFADVAAPTVPTQQNAVIVAPQTSGDYFNNDVGRYAHVTQPTTSNSSGPVLIAAAQPTTPQIDINTDQGFEVGLQVSDYRYQEHVVANTEFMHQTSAKYGLTFDGTAAFQHGLFLTGDFRFAYSKNDYWSAPTGNIKNFADDFIGEGRLLFGKDVIYGDVPTTGFTFDTSPYLGVGYRDLWNDSSAISGGYRRNSEYFYVPLGLTERFRVQDNARITANAEYDLLLQGRQTSYLSDVSGNLPDVENDQNHGYGIRGSVMYEQQHWSIGPFVNYWNIDQSNISAIGDEPHNQTLEYGGQARYRF